MTIRRSLLALLLVGCGATPGAEVPFNLRVDSALPTGSFTTSLGWTVTLDEARIVVSAVYLFENPPPSAARDRPITDRLASLFLSTAWAHAGSTHFSGGACLGELLDQAAIDLVAGAATAVPLIGNAGRVRSFSVLLDAPRGDLAKPESPTHGHHAWVRGTATKDGTTILFEGGLDVENTGRLRYVDGITTDFALDAGGTFSVAIDPRAWFDTARFESLTTDGSDGRKLISAESQVRSAWFIGARSARAFAGTWQGATP